MPGIRAAATLGTLFAAAVFWLLAIPVAGTAEEGGGPLQRSTAETIYLPAYSELPGAGGRTIPLASIMTVHNVDPGQSITLSRVSYHGHDGAVVQDLLEAPIDLAPLASWTYQIGIADRTGGVGANFLVEWQSSAPALSPIAETLLYGAIGAQGISFTTRGRVISRE